MDWQPIETAPKESGKSVLLYVPENRCVFAAYWDSHESRSDYGICPSGWKIFGGPLGSGWRDFLQRASHWMPLPKPPNEIDSGG